MIEPDLKLLNAICSGFPSPLGSHPNDGGRAMSFMRQAHDAGWGFERTWETIVTTYRRHGQETAWIERQRDRACTLWRRAVGGE